jgi:ComF family protein
MGGSRARHCSAAPTTPHDLPAAGRWRIASVIAPFAYAPPLDHYLHALKYREARSLGRALALLLVERLAAAPRAVDALVPVPLHASRLRRRGYNQAVEIARILASELAIPLLARGAHRTHARKPQSDLTAGERQANVAGAYSVTRRVDGLRLAIIDDVITTGATVNALAKELHTAGAAQVEAWAICRTL